LALKANKHRMFIM